MKNELFAIPFSSSRPQRKLVTYYLTCFDLDVQRQSMAQEEAPHMDMGGMV